MNKVAEVFPPGEFLKDELEARGWSQVEFAEIIGRPPRLINEIIAGKRAITPETAVQLGASLGTSAEVWLNLEGQYQLSRVSPAANDEIQRKAGLYARFPVKELVRRGWVEMHEQVSVLEERILKFYDINSLNEEPSLAYAAKKSGDVPLLQEAWLHRVRQIAQTQVVSKYRPDAFITDGQHRLKALMSAVEEIRHVPKILNEFGIRFVLVEALAGSKIDGACFWLTPTQPAIGLSARLDRVDNFWFVLRHELEHVLKGHGRDVGGMVDTDLEADDSQSAEEREANAAAQEFGVPSDELRSYMNRVNPYFFSEERVLGFAKRLGVHPGIVVGRLQKQLARTDYPNPYKFLRGHLVKVRQILAQAAPADGWGDIYPI